MIAVPREAREIAFGKGMIACLPVMFLFSGTLSKRDNAVCCYLAIYPDLVAAAT
jgi:hypothetical protein